MVLNGYSKKKFLWKIIRCTSLIVLIFCCWLMPVIAAEKNDAKVITLTASSWVPYIYKDNNGNAKGLYIDILSEIFEKEMGLDLKYNELPWKRAQVNLKHGLADLLLTVPTKERLEYAVKSDLPVMELFLYVYTYKDHPRLNEINSIKSGLDIKKLGLIPVTNRGNSWHKLNIDSFGVETYYVNEEENSFRFLSHKRADITIEPLYAGSYLINKLGLASKIVPTKARFEPTLFHLLLSKKSKHIKKMDRINQIIKRLKTSGRLGEILKKYADIE